MDNQNQIPDFTKKLIITALVVSVVTNVISYLFYLHFSN
jgi:hypothetical protein